jgi:tetratricopeptide (TPR) repeat protein
MIAHNTASAHTLGLWHALCSKESKVSNMVTPMNLSSATVRSRWGHKELAKEALRRGDYARAKLHLTNIKVNAEARGDFKAAAVALNDLAWIHVLLGHTDKASHCYRKTLEFWKNQRSDFKLLALNEYIFFIWDYTVFLRTQGEFNLANQLEQRLEVLMTGMSNRQIAVNRADRLCERGQYFLAEQIYEDAFIESGVRNDLSLQLKIADKLVPLYQATGKQSLAASLQAEKQRIEENRLPDHQG